MKLFTKISPSTKLFIGLIVIYAFIPFLLPADHLTMKNYQLSSSQYHYLIFTVRLPIIAVWSVAYYSYRRLLRYALSIKDTPEGDKFAIITKGVKWVAWGTIVPAVATTILNSIANSRPSFTTFSLVLGNYFTVVVALFAFTYVSAGTRALGMHSKVTITAKHIRYLVFALVVLGVIFCVLINSKLQSKSLGNSFNSLYLPNWAVWFTLVIPYLYAWFLGLFAAMELVLIAHRTTGIIYRQALQFLAIGLVLIVVSMCGLQYFRAVIPRTGHLAIGPTLIFTYVIYGVSAIGSILLAIGARRLQRIEDI